MHAKQHHRDGSKLDRDGGRQRRWSQDPACASHSTRGRQLPLQRFAIPFRQLRRSYVGFLQKSK
jgi:hypothetical protein